LSRGELSDQLEGIGFKEAGDALAATIYGAVPLDALAEALRRCDELRAIAGTPDGLS